MKPNLQSLIGTWCLLCLSKQTQGVVSRQGLRQWDDVSGSEGRASSIKHRKNRTIHSYFLTRRKPPSFPINFLLIGHAKLSSSSSLWFTSQASVWIAFDLRRRHCYCVSKNWVGSEVWPASRQVCFSLPSQSWTQHGTKLGSAWPSIYRELSGICGSSI